jgi:hypothetical protein
MHAVCESIVQPSPCSSRRSSAGLGQQEAKGGNCIIIPTPMPLGQQSEPFDDPDWLYEIKHDGFRALALIDPGHCWFVSRRKHKFHGFRDLAAALVREVNAEVAVLDGELAVPDQTGRTVFAATMKHRQQARFYAFDLLYLNGEDLRHCPCSHEKQSSDAFCLHALPMCCMWITRRDPASVCMNWPARSRRDCGEAG